MYKARFEDNNTHQIGEHTIDASQNTLLDFEWQPDDTFHIVIDGAHYRQDCRKFAIVEIDENGKEITEEEI